jgi:hypothetical protein
LYCKKKPDKANTLGAIFSSIAIFITSKQKKRRKRTNMRRLSFIFTAAVLLAIFLLVFVVAPVHGSANADEEEEEDSRTTATTTRTRPKTRFLLPARPEGITEGPGSTVFVSQILSGQVLQINVVTGERKIVVPTQTNNRQAWGLWYLSNRNSILVAGGGPSFGGGIPELYEYDLVTGMLLTACAPVALNPFGSFLNDVTVWNNIAYVTDSVNGKLMAVDLNNQHHDAASSSSSSTCDVWEVDLPANFDPEFTDDFGANGIAQYKNGLLVGHEIDGSIWYISGNLDRRHSGSSTNTVRHQEVIPNGGAPFADGLLVRGNLLYVTQNLENKIGVFRLSYNVRLDTVSATWVRDITSPLFATPATSAIRNNYIYSTNSRFASLPDIAAEADDDVIGIRL